MISYIKTLELILKQLNIIINKVTGIEKEIVYLEGIIKGTDSSS